MDRSEANQNKLRNGAMAVGAVMAGAGAMFWPFIAPAIRRHVLPYIPATPAQLNNVVAALETVPVATAVARTGCSTARRRMVDLGSGDGRLVVAAVRGWASSGRGLHSARPTPRAPPGRPAQHITVVSQYRSACWWWSAAYLRCLLLLADGAAAATTGAARRPGAGQASWI